MILDRSRPIVRYYFWLVRLFNDDPDYAVQRRLDYGTSLCLFVSRIVFQTTILGMGALAIGGIGFGLIRFALRDPMELLIVVGFALGIFATVAALIFLIHCAHRASKSGSIIVAYIKAAKRGVCPLIKFE